MVHPPYFFNFDFYSLSMLQENVDAYSFHYWNTKRKQNKKSFHAKKTTTKKNTTVWESPLFVYGVTALLISIKVYIIAGNNIVLEYMVNMDLKDKYPYTHV